MSVFKKVLLHLGLGPDEEYESPAPVVARDPAGQNAPRPGPEPLGEGLSAAPSFPGGGHVEALHEPEPIRAVDAELAAVRPLGPMGNGGAVPPLVPAPIGTPVGEPPPMPRPSSANVRPIPASTSSAKPHVINPRAFNDAQEVADRFRSTTPVVMNLKDVDRDLSRRLIDFASGLCYGLNGKMEKTTDRVYLLQPADAELSAEDRRMLRERGLHDG